MYYNRYDGSTEDVEFSSLIGKTIAAIQVDKGDDHKITFSIEGENYVMYHSQDCCESVEIEDIAGDLEDLIGSPLIQAEVASNSSDDTAKPELGAKSEYDESYTWTFYKLATIKGSITIRWYGSSNGYYSESVDFIKVKESTK